MLFVVEDVDPGLREASHVGELVLHLRALRLHRPEIIVGLGADVAEVPGVQDRVQTALVHRLPFSEDLVGLVGQGG